jgi:hypothetical protein
MCASHRSSNFPRSERSSFPAEVIIDMAFMRHYYLYISSGACMQALSVKLLPILATIWAEEFCGSLIGQGRWFRFGSYSWCTFKEPLHLTECRYAATRWKSVTLNKRSTKKLFSMVSGFFALWKPFPRPNDPSESYLSYEMIVSTAKLVDKTWWKATTIAASVITTT